MNFDFVDGYSHRRAYSVEHVFDIDKEGIEVAFLPKTVVMRRWV